VDELIRLLLQGDKAALGPLLALAHELGRVRDDDVINALVTHARRLLPEIAHRRLGCGFQCLRDRVGLEDVAQTVSASLQGSFRERPVVSGEHFYRRVRWRLTLHLIDLSRNHTGRGARRRRTVSGQCGAGENQNDPLQSQPDREPGPSERAEWSELHELIERLLTKKEQQVVYALFFRGLTQEEAAKELGFSVRTVRRLWVRARAKLGRAYLR
jgi:RNA polymerase sigma factor (sigma-70 family)